MRAVIIYPRELGLEETQVDVPLAQVEDPSRFEPESLYPVFLNIPSSCPTCDKMVTVACERRGFRFHDDGPIAVYHFLGVNHGAP